MKTTNLDTKIEEMVRNWFGEPVLAVEDQIKQLIREQRAEVLKAASERINGSSVFWPNYANLEREHAVNDCRNAALGILKHLEALTDSHKEDKK